MRAWLLYMLLAAGQAASEAPDAAFRRLLDEQVAAWSRPFVMAAPANTVPSS
ncbi:MAG TPA: hypothetical protein VF767_06330 [Bryobacteraceae bacterium]